MPNPFFAFKKFTVWHDRCAMKVGTDGVLLGAWTDVTDSRRILDIGTGTGLIALMLAQRCPAQVTAAEIDEAAVEQARGNVLASPWKDRIMVLHQDICTYRPEMKFDTIVSNPPYFVGSLKGPDQQRNTARHTDTLDAKRLFESVSRLLDEKGCFSLVIPAEQVSVFVSLAAEKGLHLSRHTAVITRPGLPPKRALLEFRFQVPGTCCEDELVVELDRHVYSEGYRTLTSPFYLKM